MSSINGKLGLRPAGVRAMMKLPADRALRNLVTAARCPACHRTGAMLLKARQGEPALMCSWCNHKWALKLPKAGGGDPAGE
jgi:hypothetical protein